MMVPVKEIRIYVEGGGNSTALKAQLRTGFDGLLKKQKQAAASKGIRWNLTPCGTRNLAKDAFLNGLENYADALTILLVDAEAPFKAGTRDNVAHLNASDGWDLSKVDVNTVHLMIQCMEAWVVADPEALFSYYGQYFSINGLPQRLNLEEEPKTDLARKLERATADKNNKKGTYAKIKHASDLLKKIDPVKVSKRCPSFAAFTEWLDHVIRDGYTPTQRTATE